MLMHGCKEGQCAACKSFVLDGDDIELDRYSTFALPDFEKEEGFTLLCRAHVYEDVTIELLNYDEEMIRSGLPIQEAVRRGRLQRATSRHDMRHLVLKLVEPTELAFFPGQYVDITVPGTRRRPGRSRWPTPPARRAGSSSSSSGSTRTAQFSQLPGQRAGRRRPARRRRPVRRLHAARRAATCDLVFVGGGAGMAPILSVLRSLAERGSTRKATYYYGARRQQDLCFEKELAALEELAARLPLRAGALRGRRRRGLGRRGRPDHRRRAAARDATSPAPTPTSAGRRRWSRRPWTSLSDLGAPEKRIYYDKFTTTGTVLIRTTKQKARRI